MFTSNTNKMGNGTVFALGLFAIVALVASFIMPLVGTVHATSVTEHPDLSVCPFESQEGRTIVDFGDSKVRSNQTEDRATAGPFAVNIPAGTYNISLASFDGYDGRSTSVQADESWYLALSGDGVDLQTNAISDLPDGVESAALAEMVNTELAIAGVVDSVSAIHATYFDNASANSVQPVCAAFDVVEQEPVLGSITVCKIAVDGEGTLISGEEGAAFSISGITGDGATGVLPESLFEAPLAYNTDILSGIEGDDAVCLSYENLELGGYYYDEEVVTGDNWLTPLYNDQFNTPAATLADFFAYSGELFTPDTSDDAGRNTDADGHITLTENRPDRTLVVLNRFETLEEPSLLTISATKIVCENEEDLPNWGAGGPDVTASTATDFLAEHQSCELAPDWSFQWGLQSVTNPGDDFVGEAVDGWNTFGPTDGSGVAEVEISELGETNKLWVREVLKEGYIPFTFNHTDNSNDVSAEMYCHADVLNYDNYDFIGSPELDTTYHCVAFNVSEDEPTPPQCSDDLDNDQDGLFDEEDPTCSRDGEYDPELDNEENQKPVITLTGDSTINLVVGDDYTEPGYSADDIEDGDITVDVVVGGDVVVTTTPNTYIVTYNVSDSEGLAADEVTRTVIIGDGILPYAPYCGDGEVNQDWEVCDGGVQCTGQCLPVEDNQCRDLSLARVNVTAFENHSNGDATSDIFLGSSVNKIPSGAWFAIWEDGTYTTDATSIASYEDVPGLAVERQTGDIRTLLFGSHPHDGSKEHIQGNIEFFNATTTSQTSDDTGNNKLENGFDLVKDNVPGQDEVWLEDNTSHFWLTVTTADDAFHTLYEEPIMCPLVLPQCSDGEDNDQDGTTDVDDLTCYRDGEYDPELDNEENQKPVITLTGNTTVNLLVGTDYTEEGATADDFEDGDITGDVVIGGDTVATSTPGSYTVTYNVSDSEGLAADEVTRTVNVSEDEPTPPQCSDDLDNDQDGLFDEEDPTCSRDGEYDPELDNEENQKPVINLNGGSVEIFVGGSYTEEGATADDVEDGNGLEVTDISGSIDVNTLGSYTVFYNFADSEELAADEVTRTITVKEQGGGGGGGTVLSSGGGGGGPIQPSLHITNEAVTSSVSGLAMVTWNTNLPASSQVLYGTESNLVVGPAPDYGYPNASTEVTALTTEHTVIITGIDAGAQNYFRPISNSATLKAIGIELALLPGVQTISAPTQCTYLESFLRLGDDNDPVEVEKLQNFLRDFEGFTDLEVTGVFDQETFDAVSAFQARYGDEVLSPWGIPQTTGYVYITTKKKVNEIYCQTAFPLTDAEQGEVDSFRSIIDSLQSGGASDEEIEVILENLGAAEGSGGVTETGTGLALEDGEGAEALQSGEEAEENVAAVALIDRFPQMNNLVAGVFTIPDDISGLYDCLIDLLLILFIIAILWLITRETVLYRKGDPAQGRLERDRTLFFSIAMLIAVVVSALLEIYCTVLPLIVIFVALMIYYFFFTKKKTSKASK